MDMNQRQIALSLLEGLREDLIYARLNNGSRILDVADLRQYIYEQMSRIRTNAFVLDELYGNDNGNGQHIGKNGHNGKAHSRNNCSEGDPRTISGWLRCVLWPRMRDGNAPDFRLIGRAREPQRCIGSSSEPASVEFDGSGRIRGLFRFRNSAHWHWVQITNALRFASGSLVIVRILFPFAAERVQVFGSSPCGMPESF